MNTIVFRAGITFAACITCAAVGYAVKESAEAVIACTLFLAFLFTILAAAREDV